MRSILFIISLLIPLVSVAQSNYYKAIIIGEGVRIRSEGSAKGTEVSKVYGQRTVEVIEVSKKLDGLGKEEFCEKYPWIKVKWAGDSTGWIYGKYVFYNDQTSDLIDGSQSFNLLQNNYHILMYRNYSPPIYDAQEEITGCNLFYYVVFYNENSKTYHLINDVKSKEKMVYMSFDYLHLNGYACIATAKIVSFGGLNLPDNEIQITTSVYNGDSPATGTYNIVLKNGKFTVTGYLKSTQ